MADVPYPPEEHHSAPVLAPHSVEAEEALLGAILINPEAMLDVIVFLQPDDFFILRNSWVWEAMVRIHERGEAIDNLTVIEELRIQERLEQTGGSAYIAYLVNNTPHSLHAEVYGRIVERAAIRRRILEAAGDIAQLANTQDADINEVIDRAEARLFTVTGRNMKNDVVPLRYAISEYVERVEYLYEHRDEPHGVPTGFTDIDKLLGGLQKSDLLILAARPGMGKTSLLLNVALNASRYGPARVAVFSLEMSREQLVQRLVSSETGINTQQLRLGHLTEEEWERFVQATSTLGQLQLFLDDTPAISPLAMRGKCRRLSREYGLDLVVVDYLQLMTMGTGSRSENRVQEVSAISRNLKELARELNVPVIAASQLSRAVEQRGDKRPVLSDLRESGCLTGDTLVTLADTGARVPIRDLIGQKDFAIWTLNQDTMKLERGIVSNAFSTGIKPVCRLTTRLGRTIRATANHEFLTIHGWKRLDELQPSDHIATPRWIHSPYEESVSESEMALLGHLIGDGCTLPRHAIQYTTREKDLAEIVVELAQNVFEDEIIPRTVYYATSSRRLADDVQSVLLRFEINSRVARIPQPGKGRDQYHVILGGKSELERFFDDIGTVGKYKGLGEQSIREYLCARTENTNRDIIPSSVWRMYVVPAMQKAGVTTRQMHSGIRTEYCGTALYKQNLNRERAMRVAQVVQSPVLEILSESDIYWDPVKSIEPDGEEEVFDLTVPGWHNFVANNIVAHNSIEQDADVVMFIYRDEVYDEDTERPNQADIIVAKHRNGPTGIVTLFFRKELTQFANLKQTDVDLSGY